MTLYTLRPISDRTAFTGKHVSSPFTATWSDTLDILARELGALAARNVVLEADFRERDLRLDGQLRADAKCQSPAVRIAFESKHGPLTYATDKYVRPYYGGGRRMDDWQHNVRAIALSLEALRKVDRYGITRRGEQYAGWKALPAGIGLGATHMTTDVALKVIADESQLPVDELVGDALAVAIRRAKANAHPDRNNGDRSRWNAVEQAALVLTRTN